MAKLIFDPKQKRSINLENVESIRLDDNETYDIVFERLQSNKGGYSHATIARWEYEAENERDTAYSLILKEYGKRIGYENNPLAV